MSSFGTNVSDEEIYKAFHNTNFGVDNHRKFLDMSVLKALVGYRCGHTITMIMIKLGLMTPNYFVTKKAKEYLQYAYRDLMINGG